MLCENSYPTDIPRRIDVDSMSILRRYVEKKILMNFNAILTYFVQGNFGEQKIDVVLAYFMQRNFDERNIGVVPMYFFRPDFEGGKVKVVSVYFLMQF